MTTPPLPPQLPLPKRRRWVSRLLALVIFLGGAACGAGVTIVIIVRGLQHAIQHPEEAPERIANRLSHRLDLTAEQKLQVEQIIAQRQQSLFEIRREVQPKIEKELNQLEAQISDILTPQQQLKWHAILTNVREHWLPPAPPAATSSGG